MSWMLYIEINLIIRIINYQDDYMPSNKSNHIWFYVFTEKLIKYVLTNNNRCAEKDNQMEIMAYNNSTIKIS